MAFRSSQAQERRDAARCNSGISHTYASLSFYQVGVTYEKVYITGLRFSSYERKEHGEGASRVGRGMNVDEALGRICRGVISRFELEGNRGPTTGKGSQIQVVG